MKEKGGEGKRKVLRYIRMVCDAILNVTPRDTVLSHTKQGKQQGHQLDNGGKLKNSRVDASNLEAHDNIQGSNYHHTDRTRPIAFNLDRANNKPT